jgi:hypothetical protein
MPRVVQFLFEYRDHYFPEELEAFYECHRGPGYEMHMTIDCAATPADSNVRAPISLAKPALFMGTVYAIIYA